MTTDKQLLSQSGCLVALHKDVQPASYTLQADICMIGRSPVCQVVVGRNVASRLRAADQARDGDWYRSFGDDGEWVYWPLHQQIEALVSALQQCDVTSAQVRRGPNSRQYNNLAIIVRK